MMQGLKGFKARCRAAVVRSAMLAVWEEEQGARADVLEEHNARTLAALYGCHPARVAQHIDEAGNIVLNDICLPENGVQAYAIVSHEPMPGHCVAGPWQQGAEGAAALAGVRALNLELRGLSRALWLAVLWSGANPSPIRAQWYHWTSLGPYWGIAWLCSYGCPPEERAANRAALVAYAEGCCAQYKAQHSKGRSHAACTYIAAVRSIWGL